MCRGIETRWRARWTLKRTQRYGGKWERGTQKLLRNYSVKHYVCLLRYQSRQFTTREADDESLVKYIEHRDSPWRTGKLANNIPPKVQKIRFNKFARRKSRENVKEMETRARISASVSALVRRE